MVCGSVEVVALCLAVALSCATGSWLDGDEGVDRAYGDLPNMPIALNRSQPPSVCAQLCQNHAPCQAWAYCKEDCGGTVAPPQCYLKATIPKQSLNPCRVSCAPDRGPLVSPAVPAAHSGRSDWRDCGPGGPQRVGQYAARLCVGVWREERDAETAGI